MSYFVLYVKSGSEQDVVRRAGHRGVLAICPMRVRYIKGVQCRVPTYPNYVFVRENEYWRDVLQDPDVWYTLVNEEIPVRIQSVDMFKLQQFEEEGVFDDKPPKYKPRAKDVVHVTGGDLQGKSGVVLQSKKHNMVLVDIQGQSALIPRAILRLVR